MNRMGEGRWTRMVWKYKPYRTKNKRNTKGVLERGCKARTYEGKRRYLYLIYQRELPII
jgi:hypothetical protein